MFFRRLRKYVRALFVYAACMHGYKDWVAMESMSYRLIYGTSVCLTLATYSIEWEYVAAYLASWHIGQDLPRVIVLASVLRDGHLTLWLYFLIIHTHNDRYDDVHIVWSIVSSACAWGSLLIPSDNEIFKYLVAVTIPHVIVSSIVDDVGLF